MSKSDVFHFRNVVHVFCAGAVRKEAIMSRRKPVSSWMLVTMEAQKLAVNLRAEP